MSKSPAAVDSDVQSVGSETLRFKVSARDLGDKDLIGTSDPYVKLFAKRGTTWHLIGTSEVIRNVENANWAFVFEETKFTRGTNQFWKVEIWDHDHLGKDSFIGNTIVDVDAYYRSNQLVTMPLSSNGTATLLRAD